MQNILHLADIHIGSSRDRRAEYAEIFAHVAGQVSCLVAEQRPSGQCVLTGTMQALTGVVRPVGSLETVPKGDLSGSILELSARSDRNDPEVRSGRIDPEVRSDRNDPEACRSLTGVVRSAGSYRDYSVRTVPLIVVIAGDLFHYKTKYFPEDIDLMNTLLNGFAPNPVIIIPGNHDVDLANSSSLDLISPLVSRYPHVRYLRDSGAIEVNGLKFVHISVFDSAPHYASRPAGGPIGTSDNALATTCDPNAILLYHGPIDDSHLSLQLAEQFRCVMLGGNHQHQYIGTTGRVAYSGSLIQQNVGESQSKGGILWQISSDNIITSRFVQFPNRYGFVQYDLRGKTPDECNSLIAQTPRPEHILKVTMLSDSPDLDTQVELIKAHTGGKLDIINHFPPAVQVVMCQITTLLEEILKANGATEAQSALICADYKSRLVDRKYAKWTPLSLRWSNCYKYGEGNYLSFVKGGAGGINETARAAEEFASKPAGAISGIIADNMSGKSSVIDILIFALYGELLRGDKRSIIRAGYTWCDITVDFAVNEDTYRIDRFENNAAHTKVQLYRINPAKRVAKEATTPDMILENLTQKSVDETYRLVYNLIGTLDLFTSTGLYYDGQGDIARQPRAARTKLLSDLFCPANNEAIAAAIKAQVKAIKEKTAALVAPTRTVADIKTALEAAETQHTSARTECRTNVEIGRKCEERWQTLSEVKARLFNLPQAPPKIDPEVVYALESDIANIDKQLSAIQSIPSNDALIASLQKQLDAIVVNPALMFAAECGCCEKNKTTLSCQNDGLRQQLKVEQAKSIRIKEHNQKCLLKVNELTARRKHRTNLLDPARQELAAWESYIKRVDPNFKPIINIDEIEKEIFAINKQRAEIQQANARANIVIGELQAEMKMLRAELEAAEAYERDYPPLAEELARLKLYLACLGVGGLKNMILRQSLARVVGVANQILQSVVDFTLRGEVTDAGVEFWVDNTGHLSKGNVATTGPSVATTQLAPSISLPLVMGSGYQKFIISLCFRLALARSIWSSPTCIILDEGFGYMDRTNISKMIDFVAHIKDMYSFIFIISHIEDVQNIISDRIAITIDARGESHIDSEVGCKAAPIDLQTVPPKFQAAVPVVPKAQITCDICKVTLSARSLPAHLKSKQHGLKLKAGA